MSVVESAVVALFCMAFVFFVLAILYIMVMALSKVLAIMLGRKAGAKHTEAVAEPEEDWDVEAVHASSGELKLVNVDEKTAAIIIAIVCDESHIPLSELCFKSIKAIE
jgi:Na+-transporting methylmalonyl-CoA/oxaloacetate decarboxylase gamma subunit